MESTKENLFCEVLSSVSEKQIMSKCFYKIKGKKDDAEISLHGGCHMVAAIMVVIWQPLWGCQTDLVVTEGMPNGSGSQKVLAATAGLPGGFDSNLRAATAAFFM